MNLAEIVFLAMTWLLPPTKGSQAAQWPIQARETSSEREDRYREVAEAVAKAVEQEQPVAPGSKFLTAAVVLGLTFEESRWRKDVDLGTDPATQGERTGQWCMGQINIGKGKSTHGWTGPELVADRVKCFREVITSARMSWNACQGDPAHRLATYASGSCSKGLVDSAKRVATSMLILSKMTQISRKADPDLSKHAP